MEKFDSITKGKNKEDNITLHDFDKINCDKKSDIGVSQRTALKLPKKAKFHSNKSLVEQKFLPGTIKGDVVLVIGLTCAKKIDNLL